ncbi:MAG: hypothetical protein DRN04_03360 [Thermoprotei archaeon]|nr:MAG: hypothetical protein DRN04_03360 [Thermoprotei archaeon]
MKFNSYFMACIIMILGAFTGAVVLPMLVSLRQGTCKLSTAREPRRLSGDICISLPFVYKSLKEAYKKCDIAIIGRVVRQWYYVQRNRDIVVTVRYKGVPLGDVAPSTPFTISEVEVEVVIKGRVESEKILVRQLGGKWPLIVRSHASWFKPIVIQVKEDPLFKIGERVVLFLKPTNHPINECYAYYFFFGRFRVINGKVYSALYYLSEDTPILGTLRGTDYEQINGISVEEFIKILNSSKNK